MGRGGEGEDEINSQQLCMFIDKFSVFALLPLAPLVTGGMALTWREGLVLCDRFKQR